MIPSESAQRVQSLSEDRNLIVISCNNSIMFSSLLWQIPVKESKNTALEKSLTKCPVTIFGHAAFWPFYSQHSCCKI